jgi:hypothetical protein
MLILDDNHVKATTDAAQGLHSEALVPFMDYSRPSPDVLERMGNFGVKQTLRYWITIQHMNIGDPVVTIVLESIA